MNTALSETQGGPADANIPTSLVEDQEISIPLYFHPDECQEDFVRSRDVNVDLHDQNTRRVVRGMHVLDYAGVEISKLMPGFAFLCFKNQARIMVPVFMDETITMIMKRLPINPEDKHLTEVEVCLMIDDEVIVKDSIIFMKGYIFRRFIDSAIRKRNKKRQEQSHSTEVTDAGDIGLAGIAE